MSTIGSRPDHGAFIPAYLDDYPLKVCEFRIYARIMRRAGTDKGKHFESIPNMAASCGMNQKTVRNAVHVLKALGLISVIERPGHPSEIYPRHEDDWVPPENVERIRTATLNTPTKSGRGQNRDSLDREGWPTKLGRGGDPQTVGVPLPNEDHKGTPSKVLQKGSLSKARSQEGRAASESLRSEDSEPVALNIPLPVKTATADQLTGQGGVNVPPPAAAPVHDLFARRGVPQVVPIQAQFSGPWGQGYTPSLERFESWLLEHKANGKGSPSAWIAAVVDRMAKGGSRALWTEFERYESGAVEVPEQKQYSPAISKWLGL